MMISPDETEEKITKNDKSVKEEWQLILEEIIGCKYN